MEIKSYTNEKGQLVTDYSFKGNEYEEFCIKKMNARIESKNSHEFTGEKYSSISDEFLLKLRRKFEENPYKYWRRLQKIYDEMTRRKL